MGVSVGHAQCPGHISKHTFAPLPCAVRSYPEGGLTSGNSLFGAMGGTEGCTPLDAQYTFENIGEVAGAPAQAPAPAEVPSAAERPAGTAAGLILGAAAALAVFL